MRNFWQKLDKPFSMLAPMYDVTDSAFRQIIAKYSRLGSPKLGGGGPDVFFTEFVSADGLCSEAGRKKLLRELYFTEMERSIVAQIFGSNPDHVREAAKLISKMGFDGIDINMGCPDKTIMKQGAGAALIRKPELAKEIIAAAKEGANGLPVSVKTRIGYSRPDEMKKWLGALLEAKPALLTVHLRTMKEMSKAAAHWELVPEIVSLAHEAGVLIAANGDIGTTVEGREKAVQYGLDGYMVGRGIFGNPWYWAGRENISIEEKLRVMLEHTEIFENLYLPGEINTKLFAGHTKNFAVMKKHFKAYVNGWPGAADLRQKLMETANSDEVKNYLKASHILH